MISDGGPYPRPLSPPSVALFVVARVASLAVERPRRPRLT